MFSEAANPRGDSLTVTENTLRQAGFIAEAEAITNIRRRANWTPYAARLIASLQSTMKKAHDDRPTSGLVVPE